MPKMGMDIINKGINSPINTTPIQKYHLFSPLINILTDCLAGTDDVAIPYTYIKSKNPLPNSNPNIKGHRTTPIVLSSSALTVNIDIIGIMAVPPRNE